MKHMGDDGDMEIIKKIDSMHSVLREKEGELEDLEALNQTLIVKERKSNDELQEARKELISVSIYLSLLLHITLFLLLFFLKKCKNGKLQGCLQL